MLKYALYSKGDQSALRVIKSGVLDPWTIAVSDVGAFLFDSLNPNQVSPYDGFVTPYNGSPSTGNNTSYTETSPAFSAEIVHYVARVTGGGARDIFTALMVDNKYDFPFPPIIQTEMLDSDGFRGIAFQKKYTYYSNDGFLMGYAVSEVASTKIGLNLKGVWDPRYNDSSKNIAGYSGYYAGPIAHVHDLRSDFYTEVRDTGYTVVWPMPADETPLSLPSQPTVKGQDFAEVSNARVAIARQGFDINTATPEQMLLSSDRGVILVIKQGIVSLAANASTTISLPADVIYDDTIKINMITTPNGVADVYYPNLPFQNSNNAIYARAKIVNNALLIENKSDVAVDVRFVLFNFGARGASPAPSNPTNEIRRAVKHVDGNYIQFLKPNSNMPPRIDDSLFDTRMTFSPIAENGYWTVPNSTGNASVPEAPRTLEIPLTNNGGWEPMVILAVKFNNGVIGGPKIEYMYGSGHNYDGKINSESSYAKIETDKITLYAHPRHPIGLETAIGGVGNEYVRPKYSAERRVIGVRYYVLAIPT